MDFVAKYALDNLVRNIVEINRAERNYVEI